MASRGCSENFQCHSLSHARSEVVNARGTHIKRMLMLNKALEFGVWEIMFVCKLPLNMACMSVCIKTSDPPT